MEQQIKMAAKLYECRDTAKSLAKMQGEDYKEMLKPYSDIITKVMKANNLKHIPALLKISETKTYQDSGMAQMLFMAALTELMEPSAQATITGNVKAFVSGGHRCNLLSTASCPPACTNAVLYAAYLKL